MPGLEPGIHCAAAPWIAGSSHGCPVQQKWLSRQSGSSTQNRHDRPCAGHPRLSLWRLDVDGRVKPGHDNPEQYFHV
jgi:hypothetical protein